MTIESFCNVILNLQYSDIASVPSQKNYKQFEIPKKRGKRVISYLSDESELYLLQKSLNTCFLSKQVTPTCVKGFKKGENYIAYLEPHVGAKYFLRIDIANFFPSITEDCISSGLSNIINCDDMEDKKEIIDFIVDIVSYNGSLPQGAPTSPAISNIVMARLDQRILKYAQMFNITYTRYADDILFSSVNFDFELKKWFIKKIKNILASKNFFLNYSKIKYSEDEISLSGYVISKYGIRLSRNRLSDIRRTITFSRDNYETAKQDKVLFLQEANQLQLKHRDLNIYPFSSVFQFVQYLCGYRSYLISFLEHDIEPHFKKNIKKLLKSIEKQIENYYT